MNFQSYLFLGFLLVVLAGWQLLGRCAGPRPQRLWLLAAGLVFYGYSSWLALLLLVGEGLVTWLLGRLMLRRPAWRKGLLALGTVLLLAVLARFKYSGFFLDNLNALLGTGFSVLTLSLPLGLSFVTFQQIFYLRDCYHGELDALRPDEFALWLTFFPTVSSGPITRPGEMVLQFRDSSRRRLAWENLAPGLYCFSLGLFKKVLIADTLGGAADYGFPLAGRLSSGDAVLTILAYTLQLYFDFSGYCDMAWGIAKMLGFDLPRNFDSPYRAASVSDFWSRWHITLTRFFRTCVYIPLGGNRRGLARTCGNIMLIFLLSGLWHGAGWGFLLWGALHGGAMVVERLLRGKVALPRWLGWLLTFVFVNAAWVYFRAPTVGQANALLGAVFHSGSLVPSADLCAALLPHLSTALELLSRSLPGVAAALTALLPAMLLLAVLLLCLLVPNPIRQAERFCPTPWKAVVCVAALVWSVVSFSGVSTFLYVNF